MKRALGFCFIVLILISGCAGRDFVRPSIDSLILGKTTRDEIVQQFGSPQRVGTEVRNNLAVVTIAYAYASGGKSLVGGVTPARAMGFYFRDNVLVGHEFISSYAEDSSDFDESKISLINKGESTYDKVIGLMGKPAGIYIFPLTDNENDKALVYAYSQTRGSAFNLKFYQKHLVVSYGTDGIVSDVKFKSSGEK